MAIGPQSTTAKAGGNVRQVLGMPAKAETPIVNEEELGKVIDALDLDDRQKSYLKRRWLHHLVLVHEHFLLNQTCYFGFRRIIVICGVTIPVLSTLSMNDAFTPYPTIVIAILGAVVAGSAAWEGVKNYGGVWQEKWRTVELMLVEGWQFFELSGDKYQSYKAHRLAFTRFVTEVEKFIANEIGAYLAVFGPSVDQSRQQGLRESNDIVPKNEGGEARAR
jgi:hypothetical protein